RRPQSRAGLSAGRRFSMHLAAGVAAAGGIAAHRGGFRARASDMFPELYGSRTRFRIAAVIVYVFCPIKSPSSPGLDGWCCQEGATAPYGALVFQREFPVLATAPYAMG